ncbi:MAG: site-specific DNA-methyltransferase [Candidatus Sericytochromatia bacterium]|uniref:Site-specific DNA-methyltransferase n=1 Tax=Candidatus Tanganyikabacteria bacterium TaxID=2961651 RepID=A0A938BKN1_9BACT|nr:site-specific DNA-methyltransferase [Candidatus Tanganyikabacteria bacterium]
MGKRWDASGVAFDPATWEAVYRVLKPGAYLVAFGGTRTYHRMACAIEDAGFEIRDCLLIAQPTMAWIYSTGFPKNQRADLAIDRHFGAEWPVVGEAPQNGAKFKTAAEQMDNGGFNDPERTGYAVTEPATPEAKQWVGFGTAIKPSWEPVVIARKPLIGTLAENLLEHGTGALNIDASRIGTRSQTIVRGGNQSRSAYGKFAHDDKVEEFNYDTGRWPANLLLVHGPECKPKGARRVRSSNPIDREPGGQRFTGSVCFGRKSYSGTQSPGYADEDGKELVVEWDCQDGCPVKLLGQQSGESGGSKPIERNAGKKRLTGATYSGGKDYTQDYTSPGYSDEGDATRFFAQFHPFYYCPKASRSERDAGLEDFAPKSGGELTDRKDGSAGLQNPRAGAGRTSGGRNTHPTVKPVTLLRYLVKLVCPPGGTVLDCFMGSGSTGVAAVREGFNFVGVDLTEEYVEIARARIKHASGPEPHELPLFAALAPEATQISLLDALSEQDATP